MRLELSQYGVAVPYPSSLNLTSEPQPSEDPRRPVILFTFRTQRSSTLTGSITPIPGKLRALSPQQYYQVTTGVGLERAGAKVIEPVRDINLNGRTFQTVTYLLPGGHSTSRLYQLFHPESGRMLVLALHSDTIWRDQEYAVLEPLVHNLELNW